MEPLTLLASIQKLVTDNEQLRAELEEKRAKVDKQQEKMCELLHLNQK
jgi:predicted nuclease with TOPRIM domain